MRLVFDVENYRDFCLSTVETERPLEFWHATIRVPSLATDKCLVHLNGAW